MKTELKTLKNLKPNVYNSDGLGFYREDILKAEAIKWVKNIDDSLEPYKKFQGKLVNNEVVDFVTGNIATRQWIMEFFNITEEDLKNEK